MTISEARPVRAMTFLTEKLTRQNPVLGEVFRCWDSLRGGKPMPARADLDPREIQNVLGHAMVLDRARPGTIRMRVAGHHLNALMGMEVRGMPIRAFFDLTERPRLMELAEAVFTTPSILELDLLSETEGNAPLPGRMILMPMTDAAGDVTKALGAFVTDGVTGTPPRRFRIRRVQVTDLPGHGVTRAPRAGTPVPAFAEPAAPFTPRQTPVAAQAANLEPSSVPWLKIVRN